MSLLVTRCVLCGTADEHPVVNRVARHGDYQTLVACSRCALVQQAPMPSDAELRDYYASGAYRSSFPPVHDARVRREKAARDAAWLRQELGLVAGTRVHEVGCGYGDLTAYLSAHLRTLSTCWDYDLTKIPAHLRVVERPGSVSVVLALQVLEHSPDPLSALRLWRSWLRDDGVLHVQVPTLERMYGGPGYFFQKPHVLNFTSRTLLLALLLSGLRPLKLGLDGTVLHATARRMEPISLSGAELTADGVFPDGPDDVPVLIEKGTQP